MKHRFAHPMQVRFADTDAQGHMYFANYLTFCDEALAAYMRAVGCPWQTLVAQGVDMFYVRSECDYSGSAKFETVLDIHTTISEFGNSSMTSEYAVYAGDALIAKAKLTGVCITIADRSPTRVPDVLRDAVAAYEG